MSSTAEAVDVQAVPVPEISSYDVEREIRDFYRLERERAEARALVIELDGQIEAKRRAILQKHLQLTSYSDPVGTYRIPGDYSYSSVQGAAVVDATPGVEAVYLHIFDKE